MRIITEPTVALIGYTQFIEHPVYRIPKGGNGATKLCSFAAKGCYDSFGEDGRSNVENQISIIESKHGSVLEHYNISLFIEGITRGCSHEIVRHRAGFAYSQRSTRYTEEKDAAVVLEPYLADIYRRKMEGEPVDDTERRLLVQHLDTINNTFRAYPEQVAYLIALNPEKLHGTALRKWARGKARNVLSHALETRMTITGNLRAWRHFLEMRSSRHAEAEIRRLTDHISAILFAVAPDHFADYREEIVLGYPEFTTPNGKV